MDLSGWFFTFIGFASIVLLLIFLRIPVLSGTFRFVFPLLEIIIPLGYISTTYMASVYAHTEVVGMTAAWHAINHIYQGLSLQNKFATALSLLIIASGTKDAADFINSFFVPDHRPNSNGPDDRKEY